MLFLDVALALDTDTEYVQGPGNPNLPFPPTLVIEGDVRISPRASLGAAEQLAIAERFLVEVTTWFKAVRKHVTEVGS